MFSYFSLLFYFFTDYTDNARLPDPEGQDYPWAAIADSVQEATFREFISIDGQFITQDNGDNHNFNYWWNAHVLDLLVDAHLRKKDQEVMMVRILKGIKDNNEGHYPNNYYDDMEWLALSCLRAYHATENSDFLEVAEILWDDVKKGWNKKQGGGIAWRKTQLDTPANAPAVILAARMYKART